jgi:hypothetical protein
MPQKFYDANAIFFFFRVGVTLLPRANGPWFPTARHRRSSRAALVLPSSAINRVGEYAELLTAYQPEV